MSASPSGTVTFLFTDVEGSTGLVRALGPRYGDVLAAHQRLLRTVADRHGGVEVDTQGDASFFAFSRAGGAVISAVEAQRALLDHEWPEGVQVRVRMGLHTGHAEVSEGRYHGLAVHRAARISALGHGGQVLVSQTTHDMLEDEARLDGVSLRDLGAQTLKDFDRPVRVYQADAPGLPSSYPPLRDTLGRARRRRIVLAVAALLVAGAVAAGGILIATDSSKPSIAAVPPNSVGAIDPKTNKLVGAVHVDNLPGSIAAGNGQVWALSSYGGTMSRIDSKALRVVSTFAVMATNGSLSSVAIGADYGWVVYNGTLAVIGRSGGLTRIPFERNGYGDIPAVAGGRGSIWVTSQLQGAAIRVDGTTLRVVARVRTPAVPVAIAVAGEAVWVAGFDKSSKAGVLVRIDQTRDTVSATIPLPGIPGDLAVGYGGIWVTINSENSVWRIDPATGSVVRTIQVGSGPVAVAVGEGSVWVANAKDGTVSRIDPATNKVVATIRVGGSPRDVAVDSGRVWVAVL
jgi:YVTN family beta-propeller protein